MKWYSGGCRGQVLFQHVDFLFLDLVSNYGDDWLLI
jgi:hypothetical protein